MVDTDTEGKQSNLEASAHVCKLPCAIQHQVDDLLADGVVAPCVVVRSILLAGDQLLRVKQLPVGASANLMKRIEY